MRLPPSAGVRPMTPPVLPLLMLLAAGSALGSARCRGSPGAGRSRACAPTSAVRLLRRGVRRRFSPRSWHPGSSGSATASPACRHHHLAAAATRPPASTSQRRRSDSARSRTACRPPRRVRIRGRRLADATDRGSRHSWVADADRAARRAPRQHGDRPTTRPTAPRAPRRGRTARDAARRRLLAAERVLTRLSDEPMVSRPRISGGSADGSGRDSPRRLRSSSGRIAATSTPFDGSSPCSRCMESGGPRLARRRRGTGVA